MVAVSIECLAHPAGGVYDLIIWTMSDPLIEDEEAAMKTEDQPAGQKTDVTEKHTIYDLIIRGGRVFDPAQSIEGIDMDVAVQDGRIARVAPLIPEKAKKVIDATGCLVMPGLIDLHTHVYQYVTSLSVEPDSHALPYGVTTVVDCGSAGAATFEGLKRYIVHSSRCRILAAVNISVIGLTEPPECGYLPFVDSNRTAACIRENEDIAVAVKIRASRNALGPYGTIQPLWMAKEAAEVAGVPLIVHFGEPPPAYDEILGALGPGDMVTHCFRLGPMHCPLDPNGHIKSTVWRARERGVLFDIGHGQASFSFKTAQLMIRQGFFPDIISTDMHAGSVVPPASVNMPDVMSKMLYLGMPLPEVITASTWRPACSIGWSDQIGSLREGQTADIAILKQQSGSFQLFDSHAASVTTSQKLSAVWTIKGGTAFRCP